MAANSFTENRNALASMGRGNLVVPILLLTMMAMMTLPIPPILLDVFFSFNIALSVVVLLVAIYALRPLDFAVFPTVLLVATLLRLGLNVASTRVVLLNGHEGPDAAGKVIESFGAVVIGGNYAVGIVVFVILVIINFVVVTKGAGRVSEVSARFTLDAMPGKQMAIDADLNAGLINQEEARARREEIASEADFYGSMDGASKFVRGDAVAGILILFINLIGGVLIGMLQHDLEFSEAMKIYSLLTIGDGLVAQIPALLLSVAAAIMVTRARNSKDMGDQVVAQMFASPRALAVTAIIFVVMGAIPGMPHVAFWLLAVVSAGAAWMISQRNILTASGGKPVKRGAAPAGELLGTDGQPPLAPVPALPELGWDDVQPVDPVGLEIGYRLIPLVDKTQGGELLGRIKGIRKKLSQEIGFLIPSVHIRDNLDLMPNGYRILLQGVLAGEGEIYPDREMAINPGQVFGQIEGMKTRDPAFGLEATWIESARKDEAQTKGYTVVDASTVVATHLNQLLMKHMDQLLGYDEVQSLLDQLAKQSPKLVEELVPNAVSMGNLLMILKSLLKEGVPIRDIRSIASNIATTAARTKDPAALTASVRTALGRIIVQNIYRSDTQLSMIALTPAMEQLLLKSVQQAQTSGNPDDISLEPTLAEKLQSGLREAVQRQEMSGKPAVLVVSAPIRALMARFSRYVSNDVHVLGFNEIPDDRQVTIETTIG
jgi:flagellar biosynthesis protein FlhA